MPNKTKRINVRVTEVEYRKIIARAKKANMNVSNYVALSAMKDEIFIYKNLGDLTHQLSKLGNNINQLTMLAHQGKLKTVDLTNCKKELSQVWSTMAKSTESVRRK
ncbi:plasmid mobilization relaxosome protein MobC [Clostridiaceae bacterium M8S5]|nr:plasmid mobilization relaxosome protein MobC [Clostridiaceae bacterium M8S5]